MLNAIEMDSLAMEYRAIQNEIDKLTEQLETVKDTIKAKMAAETDFRTETFHFIYKTVFSSRFDSTAFRKDNPAIASQYMKQTESRPLKIM